MNITGLIYIQFAVDNSDRLVIILYLILIDCLLHGVYFICVEGYHFYVSYRIAAAQIGSEKQLLLVRDIITDITLGNCIIGAIFFLMTPFVWLARYFSMKAVNINEKWEMKSKNTKRIQPEKKEII
jgi:hypothetical protein